MNDSILSKNRVANALGGLGLMACGIIASLVIGVEGLNLTASSHRQPNTVSVPGGFHDEGAAMRCDERGTKPGRSSRPTIAR